MQFYFILLAAIVVAASADTKLYVGGLSWTTTDDMLKNVFSQFGGLVNAEVIRDQDTGRSRGFGFVVYDNEESANMAIQAMNDQELDGRRIKVNLANQRG